MRSIIVVTLCVITSLAVCAQTTLTVSELTRKLKELRSAVEEVETSNVSVEKSKKNLRLLINDIIVRLDKFDGIFPNVYSESLQKSITLINAAKNGSSHEALGDILNLTYKDLTVKFKEKSGTFESEFYNELLEVTVKCIRDGKSVNNLRVRYALLGYLVNTDNPDGSFGALTSPSSEKMSPGYYKIWVTEDGSLQVLRSWTGEIRPNKENKLEFSIQ